MWIVKRESGFSMLESLVAIALLTIVGLLLTYFSANRLSQVTSKQQVSCTQHATLAIDKIRALGGVKSLGVLDMQNNEIVRPGGVQNRVQYLLLKDEWLTSKEALWSQNPSSRIILQNHKALIGSISLLNALYESDNSFCGNPQGSVYSVVAPQELVESGDFENLKNASSTMRIQPYNIHTGATLSCIHPLVVMPAGFAPGAPQAAQAGVTALPAEVRNNVGFKVTVFTNYEDTNGSNKSCSVSAQYSYPNVAVNPNTLEDLSVQIRRSSVKGTINNSTNFSACETQVPFVQVNVQTTVPQYNSTRGMVMLCRDQSTFAPAAGSNCIGAPTMSNNFTANSQYVPCHELRICGQSAINSSSSQTANGYVLNYEDINIGCQVRVEARLVDMAQNIAAVASDDLLTAPTRYGCASCGVGYTNRPATDGFCLGGGRTPANSCDPVVPPTPFDGTDGQDGASDGGNSDGKGNDGGDGGK